MLCFLLLLFLVSASAILMKPLFLSGGRGALEGVPAGHAAPQLRPQGLRAQGRPGGGDVRHDHHEGDHERHGDARAPHQPRGAVLQPRAPLPQVQRGQAAGQLPGAAGLHGQQGQDCARPLAPRVC